MIAVDCLSMWLGILEYEVSLNEWLSITCLTCLSLLDNEAVVMC